MTLYYKATRYVHDLVVQGFLCVTDTIPLKLSKELVSRQFDERKLRNCCCKLQLLTRNYSARACAQSFTITTRGESYA